MPSIVEAFQRNATEQPTATRLFGGGDDAAAMDALAGLLACGAVVGVAAALFIASTAFAAAASESLACELRSAAARRSFMSSIILVMLFSFGAGWMLDSRFALHHMLNFG